MTEDKMFFKGHKLDYSGHVIGAFPSVDVIQQQTEEAIKQMTKNINQRIIEYCLKINIDPDVLLKQKAEIEMLLVKNDLLQDENKKLKEAEVWHYPSKGELPKCDEKTQLIFYVNCYYEIDDETITRKRMVLGYYEKSFMNDDVKLFVEKSKGYSDEHLPKDVIAWKEIVLPKESE